MHALYLCYFGLREPLVQTQVLPYLRQIAAAGIQISLLTFEPRLRHAWTERELADEKSRLASEGIRWFYLPYHKRPSIPATSRGIIAGARFAARMARREGVDVLHARAHIPMAMALLARRWSSPKLIFDIRGLMAEEYSDAGVWRKNSTPFRVVKAVERAGIRRADQVVVLTKKMRDWLVAEDKKPSAQIEVIPCCVDVNRFEQLRAAELNNARGRERRFEIVYAGSVTGLYLLEEMARFFLALRSMRPEAFFRVLTVSSAVEGAAVLRRVGVRDEDFWIGAVEPSEVPVHLLKAGLGISFRKPTFSQMAASPTKIPEYLAIGLPLVCNAGIGDMDEMIEREGVGIVLHSFDEAAYILAARQALALAEDPATQARCISAARRYFDLQRVGGAGYVNVYRRLDEQRTTAETGIKAFS